MIDFEKFKSNLNDLVIKCDSSIEDYDRNEAQTRFDLIDTVLFECLDWSKDETKVERSSDGKYIVTALQKSYNLDEYHKTI